MKPSERFCEANMHRSANVQGETMPVWAEVLQRKNAQMDRGEGGSCDCECHTEEYPRYAETDGVVVCDWCKGEVAGWNRCTGMDDTMAQAEALLKKAEGK